MTIPFFLLLLPTILLQSAAAFPNAAGSCRQGQAAVHGAHLRRSNVTTGQLSDGGFEIHLNNVSLSDRFPTLFDAGVDHTLSLVTTAGGGQFFRGFLLRLDDGPEGAFEPLTEGVQIADICRDVPGVTHTGPNDKQMVSTSLLVDDADRAMRLDVSVVVRNVVGNSEYYYSRYSLISQQKVSCAPRGGTCTAKADCCSEICKAGFCFESANFGMSGVQKLGSNRGGAGGGAMRRRRSLGVRGRKPGRVL